MHYLHLGDRQIHYVIDQPSSLPTSEAPLPFQHWQWDIHCDQPIPLLLQQVADLVPHSATRSRKWHRHPHSHGRLR